MILVSSSSCFFLAPLQCNVCLFVCSSSSSLFVQFKFVLSQNLIFLAQVSFSSLSGLSLRSLRTDGHTKLLPELLSKPKKRKGLNSVTIIKSSLKMLNQIGTFVFISQYFNIQYLYSTLFELRANASFLNNFDVRDISHVSLLLILDHNCFSTLPIRGLLDWHEDGLRLFGSLYTFFGNKSAFRIPCSDHVLRVFTQGSRRPFK